MDPNRKRKRRPLSDRTPKVVTGSDVEKLLRVEQEQVASIIKDVVTLRDGGPSEALRAALRQRVEKLSPAARITARVMTKLQLSRGKDS